MIAEYQKLCALYHTCTIPEEKAAVGKRIADLLRKLHFGYHGSI
jgi:hypothetical protein